MRKDSGYVYTVMNTSLEFIPIPDNTWRLNIFQFSTIVVIVTLLVQHIKLCPCTFLANIK